MPYLLPCLIARPTRGRATILPAVTPSALRLSAIARISKALNRRKGAEKATIVSLPTTAHSSA
jgi:hypothetical protein